MKKQSSKAKPRKKTTRPTARAVEAEVVTDAASGAAASVIADDSTAGIETDSDLDELGTADSNVAERARSEAAEWSSRGWTPSDSLDDFDRSNLPMLASSEKGLVTADPVALYMAEVKRYPLLTREQEEELAKRYKETGDPRAAEMLVTSNLRFVVKVAAEYSKFGARLIDLIQEGNVGLMHAVREFNPYRGVRLITYAVWWIRGYIQDYLMRQYSMVRIGTTQAQRKLFYRLQKEKDLLESMGQEATVKLLSSRLGVTEDEVTSMAQRLRGRDVSLQQTVDESGRTTLLDLEPSEDEPVDDRMGREEMLALLQSGIEEIKDDLNERERELLENRLLADEPLTLQEIGEKYGVTREAVRQMENRLMLKIKKALEARLKRR